MAYSNVFPATYQSVAYPNYPNYQMQPQPQGQPQAQMQPQFSQNNPMIWVQGETGAKSYLLAPNTTLPLWDSENQVIYLKSTDASGMPSMKILDYTIRDAGPTLTQNPPIANSGNATEPKADFVTHDELKDFERKITSKIDDLFEKEARHESHANDADANADKK